MNLGSQMDLIVSLAVVWEVVWKGIALWKSAKKDQKYWFVALLLLNTIGILPILYLVLDKYVFSKKSGEDTAKKLKSTKNSK